MRFHKKDTMKNKVTAAMRRKLSKIKIVAMDVDGVLTDGGMYYSDKGEVMKKFNARDGKAIEIIRDMGLKVALITGEQSAIVKARARKLNIEDVYLGCCDKIRAAEKLLGKYNLGFENMLYVGDDLGDIELLKRSGAAFAPHDASRAVIECADHVCQRNGGEGVMSEINSMLLSCGSGKYQRKGPGV